MLYSDQPIKNLDDDRLNRKNFVKNLANSIVLYRNKANCVLSLEGKWGSGKTSILNMVINEIESHLDNSNDIIIIKFNPWNFTEKNQLINQFFITLKNNLEMDYSEKNLSKLGESLETYSAAMNYVNYIPKIGPYLSYIPDLLKDIGKSVKEVNNHRLNDVFYMKEKLKKELLELDSKILVIIDDIDRLSSEEISLIFKLVSAVADLPNIIYLLSYDRSIVSRALSKEANYDGEEYLEKIVQVSFNVPLVEKSRIHDVLLNDLKQKMEMNIYEITDKERWSNVFNACIKPFINTLRDAKRYLNTFHFMYESVKEEVDFIDMAGISSLSLFAPEIFNWISQNKFSLIYGNIELSYNINDLEKKKEEAIREFTKVYKYDPEVMLGAISSLFPSFISGLSSIGNDSYEQLNQKMRISSANRFDIYFSLSLDNIKISRREFDKSLLSMRESELRLYLSSLKDRGLLKDYIREFNDNVSRIPQDRIELFLSLLLFESGRISSENSQLKGGNFETISVYKSLEILSLIESVELRYSILYNMFSNSDFESFQNLLYILHLIELRHGRIAKTNNIIKDKIIEKDKLEKLEKLFLIRKDKFIEKTNLLDWKEARRASMLWEFMEKDSYKQYMTKILSKDIEIIKFMSLKIAKWSGTSSYYTLTDDSYKEYFTDEELIYKIEKLKRTKGFWELDDYLKEIAAALILIKKLNKYQADEKLIQRKLNKWKREFQNINE